MILPRGEIGRCLGEDDDLLILLLKESVLRLNGKNSFEGSELHARGGRR
jgi:hypothetical protein